MGNWYRQRTVAVLCGWESNHRHRQPRVIDMRLNSLRKEMSTDCTHAGSMVPLYTHTHPFNGPFSGTTQVSHYQKGKTNLDFAEASDSEWQWHQLGHMQVCITLQTDNHSSTPPLSFLQAGCPSCRPTNGIKALKGFLLHNSYALSDTTPVDR